MGYFFWDAIPRKADDPTRIAQYIASELAKQDELSELGDVNIPAPDEGDVLTWESPYWIAAAPGDGDGDLSIWRYGRIGRYNPQKAYPSYNSSSTAGANLLVAKYFFIPTSMTFDRIGIWVAGGVAGNIRLGIYNNSDGYPSSLVLDAGTVDCTASGVKEIVINQVLSANMYWLVWLSDVNPSIQCIVGYAIGVPIGTTNLAAQVEVHYQVAQAYGALPANYPGGASVATHFWAIDLRRSA